MDAVGNNPRGCDLAWAYVKSHYEVFLGRYKTGMLMNWLVKFTSGYAAEEKARDIEAFFEENESPVQRVVKQSVEAIRLNSAWLERDGKKIREFLMSQ